MNPQTLDTLWNTIQERAGEEFHTVTGIPFTYQAEENRLIILRNERRVTAIRRTYLERMVAFCPCERPSNIDLPYSGYVWAILHDDRMIALVRELARQRFNVP